MIERKASATLSRNFEVGCKVRLEKGIIRVAPALEMVRIVWTVGVTTESRRRYIDEPEKKLDVDEMR